MLTVAQIGAIIGLLMAFGVDGNTIAIVHNELIPPIATSTNSVATTTSQTTIVSPTTFTPIQTTIPNFGAVSVQQTPAIPPLCDDTPVFSISPQRLVTASTSNIIMNVSATSACGSNFMIDWNESEYGAIGHSADGNWEYGTRYLLGKRNAQSGDTFIFSPNHGIGTYTQTLIAHDGKTTGTTTVDIVVE